jgi:hypothetical protein
VRESEKLGGGVSEFFLYRGYNCKSVEVNGVSEVSTKKNLK